MPSKRTAQARTGLNYVMLTVTIFMSFLIFGFSENIKGPAIPRIQAEFELGELQIGTLLAINSFGYLLACFFTASLIRKIGVKAALVSCLAGMAGSGVAICFSPNFYVLAISYFVMYLGNGMLEITLGIMAATIFTKNTGTMMSLSHFFYGLSSVFAPLISVRLITAQIGAQTLGWRYMYLIVLSWSIIPIVPALLCRQNRNKDSKKAAGYKSFIKDPSAWLIMLILSFAVTGELGVGGWLANFMEKTYRFKERDSALVLTAFFVCFTLARLLLGPLTDKIGFVRSLLIFTSFSGLMIVVGVLCGKNGVPLLAIAGFGIAPIYPTVMALLAKLFADNIDAAMTVTLTFMGTVIVTSNMILGAIVQRSRQLIAVYMPTYDPELSYAVGYFAIGLFCIASFFMTVALARRIK